MPAKPATIGKELLGRLNEILKEGKAEEFELASLRNKAQQILKSDPVLAYSALGMIATITGHPSQVRENFDKAVKLAPNDSLVHINYSTSLNNMGYQREAFAWAVDAHRMNPTDVFILDCAISAALATGYVRKALALIDDRAKLVTESPYEHETMLREVAAFAERHGISDEELSAIVDTLSDILQRHRIFRVSGDIRLLSDAESAWICARSAIDQPVETIVEMNIELADAIAALDLSPATNSLVSYSFVSAAVSYSFVSAV